MELTKDEQQVISGGTNYAYKAAVMEFWSGFAKGVAAGWNAAKEHWDDFYNSQI